MNVIERDIRLRFTGKRILLVEDMGMIAHQLVCMLEALHCVIVGPAGRVETAMQLASDERLDGVLLDLNLHGRSSCCVAAILRDRRIPFLLMTGYEASQIPADLQACGSIQKPFTDAELQGAMMTAFGWSGPPPR